MDPARRVPSIHEHLHHDTILHVRAQSGPPVAHSENLQESMAFSIIFASIERCLHIFPWTTEKVVSPKSKQLASFSQAKPAMDISNY